jgi:tetratricopeptide (TPR) repeat protein
VIGIVTAVAALAAAATVGGALLQDRAGRVEGEAHGQTTTEARSARKPPALELAVRDRDDSEARALRAAERLYEMGRKDEARERFEALAARRSDSVPAAVGAAVAAWPERTIERLEQLLGRVPDSAVARLNLGLALAAEGELERAKEQWRQAERREPDAPAALSAEDLLSPESPPGRPTFVLPPQLRRGLPGRGFEERLRVLEKASAAGPAALLRYGSALEQIGHRVSARRAYDRAVALAPDDLRARVAAAVVRFDKDAPATAFSRLGPLAAEYPNAPVVRFHLGLMLLWLPNVEEARRQFRLAHTAAPRTFYGREAQHVLSRLEEE